jgi:hypothetical protein
MPKDNGGLLKAKFKLKKECGESQERVRSLIKICFQTI